MAIAVTVGIPALLESGCAYSFTEGFNSFPNTLWNLDLILQVPGGEPIITRATTSGTDFLITLQSTATAQITPGRYTFAMYATEISSGQRQQAKTGVLQVIPDLAQAQPLSDAAAMLANISAAITKLAKNQFSSVSLEGVSYTRADLATLIAQRTRLQAEVIRERQAADVFRGIETKSGKIGTRFADVSEGSPFSFDKRIGQQ